MYQQPAFEETRQEILFDCIAQHPLAALVCLTADGLAANHLPMVADQQNNLLQAHLSRGNDLNKTLEDGVEALAIFQGPTHYVSASWYPGKKDHGKEVPTYNYMVVHARGRLRFRTEDTWKLEHLNALTNKMEKGRSEPWSVSDAPDDYVARQLKGLYGLELDITELVGKWKVSQNRKPHDKQGVIAGLEEDGDQDAHKMSAFIKAGL
ncbi:FMN-binding negative transcriptional regulator [Maritalea sp.]|uniref:FMN-binding negative transcriptional regulator n=1 Tax=Maritalea sp. TaxID=2003361 RepID=UPI003EF3C5EC